MKVFFLNPTFGEDFCKSARWFAKSRGRVQRHPDYLCTAISVLEKADHRCKFIDGQAKNLSFSATRTLLKEFAPDMVVIQATTPSIYSDLEYVRLVKEINSEIITVAVGAHVTAEPEDTLAKAEGSLDAVARGEYDYTLMDIASAKELNGIKGISYVKDSKFFHNPTRELIKNLDSLPFPAWQHIDPYDYHDAGKLYPFITLLGGRGCDGTCSFCLFPQVMYGRSYRPRSADSIVREIEYDRKLFPYLKEIMFEDDTFTLKRYHFRLAEICESILRKGIKIYWSCNARADIDNLKLMKLMKHAGCRMFCVGFEFGSQEILNRVRKGITLEKMRQFSYLSRKAGIKLHGCFMIGGPGETKETACETIKFSRELDLDTVQFSGVCAYPGTEFYQWARGNNFLIPRDWPEWVDKDLEQKAIINYPQLSNEEINHLVDMGLKKFYLRPIQLWRILFNIRSWADFKTKFYGLISFLNYFSLKGKKRKAHNA